LRVSLRFPVGAAVAGASEWETVRMTGVLRRVPRCGGVLCSSRSARRGLTLILTLMLLLLLML
jgi:hypothetical protein